MDVSQITALIGAAASLLCTVVVGALTFFMKKTLTSLEEADKRNAEDIKALDKNLNDLKADLPLIYVTREDYIRVMNRVEDKLDQILYGGKAKGNLGHRQDGDADLGGNGLADDGVGVHHLVDLLHGNVHQALNGMFSHKTVLLFHSIRAVCPCQHASLPCGRQSGKLALIFLYSVPHFTGRCPTLFCARIRTKRAEPRSQ